MLYLEWLRDREIERESGMRVDCWSSSLRQHRTHWFWRFLSLSLSLRFFMLETFTRKMRGKISTCKNKSSKTFKPQWPSLETVHSLLLLFVCPVFFSLFIYTQATVLFVIQNDSYKYKGFFLENNARAHTSARVLGHECAFIKGKENLSTIE